MTKIRQIIYDMRRQPLIGYVTFIATVLSVFLFMVVIITQRVKTIPFAPESCRDRLLMGKFIHVHDGGSQDGSGGMSYQVARLLYGDLEGVEQTSYVRGDTETSSVRAHDNTSFQAMTRIVDANFFKIFDHPLVAGRYYTTAENDAGLPVAVISERTARKAFGRTDVAGRTILINHKKYTVTGVVKDNSALASNGSGDIFLPYVPETPQNQQNDIWAIAFGRTSVALLVKEGVDFETVRNQVKARYAMLDTKLKKYNVRTVYHGSPFDQETLAGDMFGSNNTPDTSSARTVRYWLYAILLIVPAINLSSMLHSRMRRRISEIGVRRAFGCTRMRIFSDIIWENLIVTMAGGLVGVILGVIFAMTYSGLYENMDTYGTGVTPAISSVINWGTIAIAIAVCFILNIISASIPAWQAARLNPVEAINNK